MNLWDEYLPQPPEEEEPTEADYCAMSGHEMYYEAPDGRKGMCHCGLVSYEDQEPHDEYSAYCEELIDSYAALLSSDSGMNNYNVRFEIGHRLRNRSSEYLLALLKSAQATHAPIDYRFLDDSRMDFFVKLGMHLDDDGYTVLVNVIYWMTKVGYAPGNRIINPDPGGLMDQEEHRKVIQSIVQLYCRLVPVGRSFAWRQMVTETLIAVFPTLKQRPELVDTIAALYNTGGHNEATTARINGLTSEESTTTALVEGFL